MGEMYTMDDAPVVRDDPHAGRRVTDDEAALVRTLTPADLAEGGQGRALVRPHGPVSTIRTDEAMADYVYAIAPSWDGTIETLLLAGRVTTALARYELERRVPACV